MKKPRYAAITYFIGKYKLQFIVLTLFTFATSVLESLSVAAFFPLFSSMLDSEQQGTSGVLGTINRLVGTLPFENLVVAAAAVLITFFVTKIVLNFITSILIGYIGSRVSYDVKKQMMERYSLAHYQFYLDSRQGELIYNIMNGPTAVSNVISSGARLALLFFKGVALTFILITTLPWAAAAAIILFVSYYIFVHYLSNKISYSIGQAQAEANSDQTVLVDEFFNGFRQIITFNIAQGWVDRFDRSNQRFRDLFLRSETWKAVPRSVIEIATVGLMLGLIVTLRFVDPDSFSEILPRLGVFAVAMAQLLPAVSGIGGTRMAMMASLPNMERAHETIIGPIPKRNEGSIALDSFEKTIAFEHLSFAYQGGGSVFDGVDLTFEKGKITAIVGTSGAGKTTIINLILGLFDPTQGRVTVDGIPLQEIKSETWFSKIGAVSQDTFTYHASVAENIQIGREGFSQESIIEAAKIGNAHEFISQTPQGYDAIIGDRGMRLSGGQQQRLAIARAVLNSPEILIFDEATSSLDTVSEKLVQEAIRDVSGNRTVIIVAHRLSTIRHADKIIVLDGGKVVEEGNHEELLGLGGFYSQLVSSGT